MSIGSYLFTPEPVSEGQISDGVFDAIIAEDQTLRVACETLVTTGLAFVAGEITTSTYVDIPHIVRDTIKEIGYNDSTMGFDWETCSVITSIDKQSPDIAIGVNAGEGLFEEQGAGDQGLMFGYACNETPVLMPMPIYYAHRISRKLAEVRKNGVLDFLRPDGKSQVTIEYFDHKPKRVDTVVVAAQHTPQVTYSTLRESIIEEVIRKVIPAELLDSKTKYYINTTGRFVVGGPMGDCGLTGRKIIADTYGGQGSHGGGGFSGKDPSKVDRTASYMARYVAKNIVAAELADRVEVQVAYSIGVAEPVSLMIDTFGTGRISDEKIQEIVLELFSFKPSNMIKYLRLARPIFRKTACGGHFGREDPDFTWEKTDMAETMRDRSGLNGVCGKK